MTITSEHIPQGWKIMLSAIQQVCPSAVLAGGCLRDLDNGRDVKDLDVFIRAETEGEARQAIDGLRDAGIAVSFEQNEHNCYPEDQNLEVVLVAECETPATDFPVQFIFTNWPTDRIVERFDYGICRLAFDGQSLTVPKEYEEDKQARVFRLRRDRGTPRAMQGSVHRYARLTADKYAGWDWWPYEDEFPFEAVSSRGAYEDYFL